jgi:hypothetical protein
MSLISRTPKSCLWISSRSTMYGGEPFFLFMRPDRQTDRPAHAATRALFHEARQTDIPGHAATRALFPQQACQLSSTSLVLKTCNYFKQKFLAAGRGVERGGRNCGSGSDSNVHTKRHMHALYVCVHTYIHACIQYVTYVLIITHTFTGSWGNSNDAGMFVSLYMHTCRVSLYMRTCRVSLYMCTHVRVQCAAGMVTLNSMPPVRLALYLHTYKHIPKHTKTHTWQAQWQQPSPSSLGNTQHSHSRCTAQPASTVTSSSSQPAAQPTSDSDTHTSKAARSTQARLPRFPWTSWRIF